MEAEPRSGVTTVRIVGELDASSASLFREAAGDLGWAPCVAIDLSGLGLIDSAGLGALVGGLRRIRESGGRVALFSPAPSVSRLIRTVGFERIVPVVDDFTQAVEALVDSSDDDSE